MIRWNPTTDTQGRYESLLKGLSPDDREQCLTLWTQDRIHRANRAARRRDAQARQRVASLCWGIVTCIVLLAAISLGSALDIERGHDIGGIGPVRVIESGASESEGSNLRQLHESGAGR